MDLDALLREEKIDAIDEVRSLEGGGRVLSVRGRWLAPRSTLRMDLSIREQVTPTVEQDEEQLRELQSTSSGFVEVSGIASSTGVDSHGTEMSRDALDSMALQFGAGRGVPYAPSHRAREWHELIGRTVGASVEPVAEVTRAAVPDEPQYVLRVRTRVNLAKVLGKALVRALEDGDPIGQSIGAYFTKMTIVEDSQGAISRIIIQDVELDHLAVTRSPSNEDSDDLSMKMRDRVASQLADFAATEDRHVVSATEDDTSITIVLAKAETPSDDESAERINESQSQNPIEEIRDEDSTETIPDAVVADGQTRSEATAADEIEEIDMEKEALEQLLRSVVGEVVESKFGKLDERLDALESMRAAPIDATEILVASTKDPVMEDLRSQLAARDADLATRTTELEAAREKHSADEELMGRIMNQPIRQTRAYQADLLHDAIAAEAGDFTGLIARAKEEGKTRSLVAMSERSRPLMRLRAFDDNPDEHGYKKPADLHMDAKRALVDVCRAADRDGILNHLNPMKAAASGWSA